MTSRVIGLTGFARSGKDEVGRILVEELGFKRIAMADALKEIVRRADLDLQDEMGWPMPASMALERWGPDEVKERTNYRGVLVALGVAAREVLGPSIWVRAVSQTIEESGPEVSWVVTDVRYQNEAEWLRALHSAEVVRVIRPVAGPANAEEARSIPEVQASREIRNTGGLEDLRSEVLRIWGP